MANANSSTVQLPLAQALEMEKGETIDWVVENKWTLRITRNQARAAARKSDGKR